MPETKLGQFALVAVILILFVIAAKYIPKKDPNAPPGKLKLAYDKLSSVVQFFGFFVLAACAYRYFAHGTPFSTSFWEGWEVVLGLIALGGWASFAILFSPIGLILIVLYVWAGFEEKKMIGQQAEKEKWSQLKS